MKQFKVLERKREKDNGEKMERRAYTWEASREWDPVIWQTTPLQMWTYVFKVWLRLFGPGKNMHPPEWSEPLQITVLVWIDADFIILIKKLFMTR